MAMMSDDDLDTLRMVSTYGQPVSYTELGQLLTEGDAMRNERRRTMADRRCRPLLAVGALEVIGANRIAITERGRLAMGLRLAQMAKRAARAAAAPAHA